MQNSLLEKKIKVALIYKKDYIFFDEQHFDKTTYYFFMNAFDISIIKLQIYTKNLLIFDLNYDYVSRDLLSITNYQNY